MREISTHCKARTCASAVGNGWAPVESWPALLNEAERSVDRALEGVDRRSAGIHIVRGVVERLKGYSERSLESLLHAREFNQEYPLVHAEIGRTKIDLGRSSEALADIARAREFSPTDQVGAYWAYWSGIAAVHLGDDEAAIDWFTSALQRNRANTEPLPWLAVAYAQRGSASEAKALVDEYMRGRPDFSVSEWLKRHPTSNKGVALQRVHFAQALHDLGVP